MAWTSPRTWVANVTALTALAMNTDLRDNLNYLKGLLDGTDTTNNVTVASGLKVSANKQADPTTGGVGLHMSVNRSGGQAEVNFFNVNSNPTAAFDWRIYNGSAWVTALALSPAGKLTGLGFYDSGATSVGASTTVNLTHGFASRPRFVWGWQAAASATLADGSGTIATTLATVPNGWTHTFIYSANASVVRVDNTTGGTIYVRVFAML